MDTEKINFDISLWKNRTVAGVSVLVARNLLIQSISFVGFIFLSVFLKTWELGVFWAVSEIIAFLGYFSDVGLAAAIIQKKGKPKKEELRAVFTFQQLLVISLVLIAFLLTSQLEKHFDFQNGRFLYWALLFGFFTSSLKTIPSVLLERDLRFDRLATVDLAEQIVFTGLAVLLAWQGFGTNSWTWAVLARSLVGVILIYFLVSWPIGFNFNFSLIRPLFKFGVFFQLNSLLAMLKDRLMNIFLWGILGSAGVGILGWAQKWAQTPLRFLMDTVMRVTFPAFSRLQDRKDQLRNALERSGFFINFFILPVLFGMGFLMPKVVQVFPQYQKWQIGLTPFWFYLASFVFAATTTPLTNAFNSVGKVKITLKLMVLWTVATWAAVPVLAKFLGVNGAALGLLLVSSTSFIAWIIAKREFGVSIKRILLTPLFISLLMLIVLMLADKFLPLGIGEIVFLVILGVLVYGGISFLLVRDEIFWFINTLSQWRRKK